MPQIGWTAVMPADIVLTGSNTDSGQFVKIATTSNISHAMLALGPGQFVQATGIGVHVATFRQAMTDTQTAAVYRTKLTPAQRTAIIKNALSHVGKAYDYVEMLGGAEASKVPIEAFVSPGTAEHTLARAAAFYLRYRSCTAGDRNKIFCSELVVAAYQAAGILGSANASSYSPAALSGLPGFWCVGTLDPSPAAQMPPPP